ncbi:reverse transcriptase family protein [Inquilinus limosus]|uniref:reverse transcriptase family protein n=1 Tax=Inquilinus limosus TaxID=171674 RepID=UPI003F160E70
MLIDPGELQKLMNGGDNYIRWDDKKTGRPIQRPKPLLDRIHRRAARLLSNIETPDFLYSAVKGRSYVTNAARHSPDQSTVKIDLRKFYPSTRIQSVYHFFRDRMQCDGDVAGILANLLTVDGHLPTGSSVSPILWFFAYEDMFHDMEALANGRDCTMTCYIDDMVFTGPNAGRRLIYDAIQIARKYRLWGHKTKRFKPGQPKVITGVAITNVGPRLPNRRQKAIADDLNRLGTEDDDEQRLALMDKLVSRMNEAAQIDPSWLPKAQAMVSERRGVKRRLAIAQLKAAQARAGSGAES